jgi:hypothetical protein
MDTLYSTQQNPNFKSIASDRLFYDHWRYCIRLRLSEASALRHSLDTEEITGILNQREQWRDRVRTRWPQNNFVRQHQPITDDTRRNLYAFADFLQQTTEPYKIVISVNQCWIYSNSSVLLERIGRLPFVHEAKYTEAVVVRAKNTIALKNPRHAHRSYFCGVKLTVQEKDQLSNFFNNQPDIRISPGLKEWLSLPFVRTQDHFFVDYNNHTWLTMLALVVPGLIRKTSQLVAK